MTSSTSPPQGNNTPFGSSQSSFGNPMPNIYGQPAGLASLSLQQPKSLSGNTFNRGTPSERITPTSISQPFPIGLPPSQQQAPQQQASPNSRSVFSIGQRNILNQIQSIQQQQQAPIGMGSGLKRPINTSSTLNQNVSSLSVYARASGESQGSLDPLEFPSLGGRSSVASSSSSNQQQTARNYDRHLLNMVSKPLQEPAPEFQIQPDDFPALPGSQTEWSNPLDALKHVQTSISSDMNQKMSLSANISNSYEQALKEGSRFPGDKNSSNQMKRGIQTHPDGKVSNIPAGMVTDQFGMVGLLAYIRAAEMDQNLVALAPGIDLTTLGLSLNSPENLYSTFQSPWADSPCRPQDIDFHVPQEYLTNIFIRENLANIKLNRYSEDLLFYLFFMNGGDVLQLAAAAELYNRDWRYHKEERVWITRAPGAEVHSKTSTYERSTYYFFDATNWRKVPKEFHLEYEKLEERPQLPSALHPSNTQQQQQQQQQQQPTILTAH